MNIQDKLKEEIAKRFRIEHEKIDAALRMKREYLYSNDELHLIYCKNGYYDALNQISIYMHEELSKIS